MNASNPLNGLETKDSGKALASLRGRGGVDVLVRVFISGPIQGVEDKQEYRAVIRRMLEAKGYEVVDPWEREKVIYRATKEGWWRDVPPRDFIERDLRDVERCDVLIAYLPRLSAGTCMELFYAKLKGKKVVSVIEFEDPSPWITLHSDVLLKSLEELRSYVERGGLEELLRGPEKSTTRSKA